MSIETTYRIFRSNAIKMLEEKNVQVFESDSNERIALELYENRNSIYENYEVVDFDEDNEPGNDKSNHWKSSWNW